jgi:hypothetical protein
VISVQPSRYKRDLHLHLDVPERGLQEKMKRHAGLGLLLVFLALVQVGCAQSVSHSGTNSESESRSRSDFTAETGSRTITLDVRPAMTSVDLDVQVTLSSGSATLRLTDPNGDVRWEEEIVAPASYSKSTGFEAVAGEWALEVSLENATGGYDIQWRGSD